MMVNLYEKMLFDARCAKYIRRKIVPHMVRGRRDLDLHHIINLKQHYASRDIRIDPVTFHLKDMDTDTSGRSMIYYSIYFILVIARGVTLESAYTCSNCTRIHYRDPMLWQIMIDFRLMQKPKMRNILTLIANEKYIEKI